MTEQPSIPDVLRDALAYEVAQFDGPPDTDIRVSGADLVDWFSQWRTRAKVALAAAAPPPGSVIAHELDDARKRIASYQEAESKNPSDETWPTLVEAEELFIARLENIAALVPLFKVQSDLLNAAKALFALHEPEGRFQPSHYKPILKAMSQAITRAEVAYATDDGRPAAMEAACRAAGWELGGDGAGIIYHRPTWGFWKAAQSWSGNDEMTPQHVGARGKTYTTWSDCFEGEELNYRP